MRSDPLLVALVGSESTGKTTLALRLAAHFDAPYVPEYGRDYTIAKQRTATPNAWQPNEFAHIAREQQRLEREATRASSKLVICDTDAVATEIWLERYLGDTPSATTPSATAPSIVPAHWPAPERPIDLYLLTDPDVPFVADAIRDGEHLRTWMFERFRYVLADRALPFYILTGTFAEREAEAIALIERALAERTL